jgi:hypothetical protein
MFQQPAHKTRRDQSVGYDLLVEDAVIYAYEPDELISATAHRGGTVGGSSYLLTPSQLPNPRFILRGRGGAAAVKKKQLL